MISGEIVSIILFIIGCFAIMTERDIVKTSIGIGIMTGSTILYFIVSPSNYLRAPIGESLQGVADPLPQALMITNIILGVASTAIALGIFIKLYKKYDSSRWDLVLKKYKEEE